MATNKPDDPLAPAGMIAWRRGSSAWSLFGIRVKIYYFGESWGDQQRLRLQWRRLVIPIQDVLAEAAEVHAQVGAEAYPHFLCEDVPLASPVGERLNQVGHVPATGKITVKIIHRLQ